VLISPMLLVEHSGNKSSLQNRQKAYSRSFFEL
jgi:hypothetical protein